ncbi:acyltransferase family protein [Nocardioides sp. DS6]|uniref:Acyltransferase family protein n=1 Tax=Nocardioides eburneus TaxID=3231482 RepID=A0ABV3SUK9_9ACTN
MTATMTRPDGVRLPSARPARRPRPSRPSRLAALDGLRGIAVLGVMLFHAFPRAVPGGFVGVDVFFVLSGYLITGGLVREHAAGTVAPGRFWLRRIRRLLPALVAVVLACGLGALLVGGDTGVGFGGQLVAAAAFVTNWHLVATGNGYFAESSPPLLQHLWSLAVEEQFYVVWPLLLAGLLVVVRHRRRPLRTTCIVVAGLAAASTVAMAVVGMVGDAGRAYYGSDTHCFGLLAGALLAFAGARLPRRLLAQRVAGTALVLLVLAGVLLDGADRITYVVGLPAVVACTTLVLAAVVTGRGPVTRLLSWSPLRRTGLVSYGLYLWHWPVLVLLRARWPDWALDHPGQCAVVAFGFTGAAATASYLLLERPIHEHGFRRYAAAVMRRLRWPGPARMGVVTAGLVAVVCVAATAVSALHAPATTAAQAQVRAGEQAIALAQQAEAARPASARGSAHGRPDAGRHATPVPVGRRITAVGDSVMLASAPGLLHRFPGIDIHAKVGRQAAVVPALLRGLARAHRLRPIVLIGVGTNGALARGTLAEIRRSVGAARELVFVNVFVDRPWAGEVNRDLAAYVAHDSHAHLVDWRDAIRHHLRDLGPDHIHPGPSGANRYAATVAKVVTRLA